MSAEEYRQRLIEIFEKTENEQYIAFMVLPTESDLKLLESYLKQYPFIDLPNMECDNNGNYIYFRENKQ